MRQIVVLSGKGGTGKTTVTAALAHLVSQEASIILADADVDAANLELVLSPQIQEEGEFTGGGVAVIAPELCIACGRCHEVCRFEAIIVGLRTSSSSVETLTNVPGDEVYAVDEIGCEGCGACTYVCPVEAIEMQKRPDGEWFHSQARYGPLFHAHLFAARENSGKLVTLIKNKARDLALQLGVEYLLVDGAPGIGCPVIAAVSGMDLALLVTEPTVSGAHDLRRIVGVAQHFGVPALACINKWDLNPAKTREIASWCAEQGVPVVGWIPFDQVVTRAMVQGQPVTAYSDGPVSRAIGELWTEVKERLRKEVNRMPGLDGTGPRGLGPMTGRGEGYCAIALPSPGTGRTPYGYVGLAGRPLQMAAYPYRTLPLRPPLLGTARPLALFSPRLPVPVAAARLGRGLGRRRGWGRGRQR